MTGPLRNTLEDSLALARDLSEASWQRESRCAGWRSRDVFAHMTDGIAGLVGMAVGPAVEPSDSIERANDEAVRLLSTVPIDELIARYASFIDPVVDLFDTMDRATADTPVSLGDAGSYRLEDLISAVVFDHTVHMWWDLDVPEIDHLGRGEHLGDDRLGQASRWLMLGVEQMTGAEIAPFLHAPVRFDLLGPGRQSWTLVRRDGRTCLVGDEVTPAVRVETTAAEFLSWATHRSSWRDHAEVEGDSTLGAEVLDHFRLI